MKRLQLSTALALTGCTGLAVLIYNTWSYGCGRCSLQTFLTLGPAGLGLVGANLVAVAVLFGLRRRRRRHFHLTRRHCRCGEHLCDDWLFCPRCGHGVPPSPS